MPPTSLQNARIDEHSSLHLPPLNTLQQEQIFESITINSKEIERHLLSLSNKLHNHFQEPHYHEWVLREKPSQRNIREIFNDERNYSVKMRGWKDFRRGQVEGGLISIIHSTIYTDKVVAALRTEGKQIVASGRASNRACSTDTATVTHGHRSKNGKIPSTPCLFQAAPCHSIVRKTPRNT